MISGIKWFWQTKTLQSHITTKKSDLGHIKWFDFFQYFLLLYVDYYDPKFKSLVRDRVFIMITSQADTSSLYSTYSPPKVIEYFHFGIKEEIYISKMQYLRLKGFRGSVLNLRNSPLKSSKKAVLFIVGLVTFSGM